MQGSAFAEKETPGISLRALMRASIFRQSGEMQSKNMPFVKRVARERRDIQDSRTLSHLQNAEFVESGLLTRGEVKGGLEL